MASVRRALVLSMSERYLLIILSLASNILLARLLTPEEIGLYSVAIALIGIAQVLRDFGIGNYLIQVKTLSDDHIKTAFGFSLTIGASLFLIVYFAAPFAGSFYNDIRVVETIRISAFNFLVLPFCSISLSLLRRDMQFKKLVLINLLATIIGFTATITLAYRGFGANSMAIGALITNIATGAGTWIARGSYRVLLPSFVAWRDLMSFGARSSATNIIASISMDINDLAVGRILGFEPVAFISKAQGLMNIFHRDIMSAIRNVAYPAFAKAHREGTDLEAQYVYSVGAITAIAWPFYAFTALHAEAILNIMFGPQWNQAAPLVPWFCLAGAVAATYNLVMPLLIASGRIDLATRIDLVTQPIRAIFLVLGVIAFQSMEAFAIIFFVITILSLPYVYYMKGKFQPTPMRSLAQCLSKSVAVTVITLFIPIAVSTASALSPVTFNILSSYEVSKVLLLGAACIPAWIAGVILSRHPISNDPMFIRLTPFVRRGNAA